MKMYRSTMLAFILSLMLVIVAGCGGSAPKPAEKPATPPTNAKGGLPDLKGKKIVVYVTFHENEGKALLELFQKKTGCEFSFLRMPAGEAVTRATAEKGAPKADIILGGPADAHETLKTNGLLLQYLSPTAKDIPEYYRDKDNFWAGMYVGPLAIGVNQARFDKEFKTKGIAMPKTFEDLLNPAFKGEIIMPDPATSGTAYTLIASLSQVMGQDKAMEYMKKLRPQVAQYTSSGFTPAQKVGNGEYLIALNFIHDQLLIKKQGFPMSSTVPQNAGWEIGAVSILKGGPNPDSAKAFMDFVLSQEAGQLHSDMTQRLSTRSDVKTPEGATKLDEMPINKKYSFDIANKEKKDLVSKWKALAN